MKAQMMDNELEMMNMKKTYEEKLKQSKKDFAVSSPAIILNPCLQLDFQLLNLLNSAPIFENVKNNNKH